MATNRSSKRTNVSPLLSKIRPLARELVRIKKQVEALGIFTNRLLKNSHLLRYPHPLSLRRTAKYASFLRISVALHLAIFEQPAKDGSICILQMTVNFWNAPGAILRRTWPLMDGL
jgi:hypothetical protein